MTNADRPEFIERAVRKELFHQSIQEIETRNAGTDPDGLQELIDRAVREVRGSHLRRPLAEGTLNKLG